MKTLTIIIEVKNDTDYDGNSYSFKFAMADINGDALSETFTADVLDSDETVKTNFKTKLTDLGYTWDN